MNRTRLGVVLFVGLTAGLSDPLVSGSSAFGAEKPNILFLFADDMCFDGVAALGDLEVETPNLDRLAKRSTSFRRAYNMGSFSPAVCVASRTMLNTGRTVWHAQTIYGQSEKLRANGELWPQRMAKLGYDTYFTGKWHVQADAGKTFQQVRNVRAGMPKDTPEAYNRPLEGKPDLWDSADPKFGGFWAGGKHWSEVVGDDAVDFMSAAKKTKNPFFMYVAFNAPHDPRQAPQAFLDRYPLERVALPRSYSPLYPFREAMGAGAGLRDEKLAPFPRTEHAVRVHRREYYALISHMDAQIGRVLDALEQSGLAEKTWIFFTADHGLAVGRHGLLGKQNMYEHSLRVPFLVSGPGVAAGSKIDAPIYLQDVHPTTLALGGDDSPQPTEFQSILPLLKSPQSPSRKAIYGAYLNLQRAVVEDGWKLVLYPKAQAARLYHLAEDPEELHDLADQPEHAARKKMLFESLLRLQQELNDPLDLTIAFPNS